jgi:hypothetical protein
MANVATYQNLLRDIMELFKTRGLRHAAHAGNAASDEFVIGRVAAGGTVPNVSNKTYIYIEIDDAQITLMDEKAFGSHHPHVPDSTRQ